MDLHQIYINKRPRGLWQPKQYDLLYLLNQDGPTAPTVIGFGGSRGSAKSRGLRQCAIDLAYNYPGVAIFIVRRVLGDLLENHKEKIDLEFPEISGLYRAGDYEYDFPNGSRIVFVYAETTKDVDRVSYGPECAFLLIDQAEQFSEDELISFRICNRWPAAPPGFPKTCLFFNVGKGVGAGYLRRIFHTRKFKPNENPADYRFIQAYAWDNYEWFRGQVALSENQFYALDSLTRLELFLTHTTEGRKMNALPDNRRESELMGNFDSFSGQYYSDVWGDHCVVTTEQIAELMQPWWTRWMAQDWAFQEHAYHCWLATGKVSPELWAKVYGGRIDWPAEVVILYRELLVTGMPEVDLGETIASLTPESEKPYIRDFFLSQDAMGQVAKQSGENTVGQQFTAIMRRHGLPAPQSALQDRVNGARFMHRCLHQASMRGANIDKDRVISGPVLFISVNCTAAIENIPLAPRDDKDTEDVARVAGAVWEDVTDGIRYGLLSKLSPRSRAPVDVRQAEAMEKAGENPTARHLAALHFQEQEMWRGLAVRAPRWRG